MVESVAKRNGHREERGQRKKRQVIDAASIERLRSQHETALSQLFMAIALDPAAGFFHPHEFSAAEAARVCRYTGEDHYFGACHEGQIVAYAMLRGWDEGFTVPSLGIYLAPRVRGTGLARRMMNYLHEVSRSKYSPQIRLKVYPANTAALELYRKLGYTFPEYPGEDGQLLGLLDLANTCG